MKTLLALLLVTCNFSFAQTTFEKRWGGNGYQDGVSVCKSSDGGFVIAGRGNDGTVATTDIVILKVDSVGDSLWTKSYGDTTANDFPSAITETHDGGFLISTTTYSLSSEAPNFSDWWILRTDSVGDTLWSKLIRNIGNDRMYFISENTDHTILCAGWWRVNPGYARATLLKLSENGDSLWSAQIGSGANSYGEVCGQLDNGNYFLAGASFSGTFYGIVNEYDTSGALIVSHSYDKAQTAEVVNSVDHLPQGGYLISAKTGTVNGFDIWLIRTDENWDTIWTKTFNDPIYLTDIEARFAFCTVADSGCIFGGANFGVNSMDAVIYRIDSSGTLQWTRSFGGAVDDKANELLCLNDGGFLFSGMFGLTSNISSEFYIVRTDANGLVSGATGIPETMSAANELILFPNPIDHNNNQLNISVENQSGHLQFEIINSLGQNVFTESGFISNRKSYEIKNLEPGIYFLNAKFQEETINRKLVVQ